MEKTSTKSTLSSLQRRCLSIWRSASSFSTASKSPLLTWILRILQASSLGQHLLQLWGWWSRWWRRWSSQHPAFDIFPFMKNDPTTLPSGWMHSMAQRNVASYTLGPRSVSAVGGAVRFLTSTENTPIRFLKCDRVMEPLLFPAIRARISGVTIENKHAIQ